MKYITILSGVLTAFLALTVTGTTEAAISNEWPDWIGQIEWLETVSTPIPELALESVRQQVVNIPEQLRPIHYKKVMQPASLPYRIVTTGKSRPGSQWWPDWIGVPEWY